MVQRWLKPNTGQYASTWDTINTGDTGGLTASTNGNLYAWGTIQFVVTPFNVHEFDHDTETDWAKKEIAGAAIYREWVGENDERLLFRGRLFPYRIGGLVEMDIFDAKRRLGIAALLMRGDGVNMGWFVCERLVRANTFLTEEGVGQQVAFECSLARVPIPSQDSYWAQATSSMMGGNP